MKCCVVVSACRNPAALDWTLLGWRHQTRPPDELIVTEDDESPAVAAVVARHADAAGFPIHHLTQENQGFRKCLALNRALQQTQADWVVFTDQDVLPRADVLKNSLQLARPSRFIAAGSHLNLPMVFYTSAMTEGMVETGQIFDASFLRAQGIQLPASRLLPNGVLARWLDVLTARNAFVGNHTGAWRHDLLRVGGFDESLGYGGEDTNIGIRLNNAGVRGIRARHQLVMLHLDHPRPYAQREEVRANRAFNDSLRRTKIIFPRRSSLAPA